MKIDCFNLRRDEHDAWICVWSSRGTTLKRPTFSSHTLRYASNDGAQLHIKLENTSTQVHLAAGYCSTCFASFLPLLYFFFGKNYITWKPFSMSKVSCCKAVSLQGYFLRFKISNLQVDCAHNKTRHRKGIEWSLGVLSVRKVILPYFCSCVLDFRGIGFQTHSWRRNTSAPSLHSQSYWP